MTMMTSDAAKELFAFLDSRVQEDSEIAWGADTSPWREGRWDGQVRGPREVLSRKGDRLAVCWHGGTYGHILQFDPTRMLAECELKKQIIDNHRPEDPPRRLWAPPFPAVQVPDIVLAIARLYSDHPDFKPEWKA